MRLKDLKRHEAGELARRLFKSGEKDIANGALETLAYDLGIISRAEGFIQGTLASEKGIDTATGIYSQKYHEILEGLTVNDLSTHYDQILKGYLSEEGAEPIRAEFNRFSGQTYGDIIKQVTRANYVVQGESEDRYDFSEEEVWDARVTLERYKGLITSMNLLDDIKFENLRPRAAKRTHEAGLEDFSKGLKDAAEYREIIAQARGSE